MATDAMLAWLRSLGAHISPKLDLFAPVGGAGRGVMALECIAAGEPLLVVPTEATLRLPPPGER